MAEAQSVVLVPLVAEGELIGLLGAADKPGGFSDADVQILSTFAGPVATFLRSRQTFDQKRRQAARFERLAALAGDMAAVSGRARLLELTVRRVQRDLGYERVGFPRAARRTGRSRSRPRPGAGPLLLGPRGAALGAAARRAARGLAQRGGHRARGARCAPASTRSACSPSCAAGPGPSTRRRRACSSTLGGQLALALRRAESEAATEHLARQMATLYDLGLETAALTDLQALFARATEEAGRLIKADHTLGLPLRRPRAAAAPVRGLGARAVAAARAAAELPARRGHRRPRGARPAAGARQRRRAPRELRAARQPRRADPVRAAHALRPRAARPRVLYGVLNATRRPGSPPFTDDDLEYLTRFAGQLSIAVANSVAFAAERERSDQLALVNAVLRESAALLSRERILETAVRRIQEAFRPPLVAMLVPEGEVFRLAASAGALADATRAGRARRSAAGPQGRALREKRHRRRERRRPRLRAAVARGAERPRGADPVGRRGDRGALRRGRPARAPSTAAR